MSWLSKIFRPSGQIPTSGKYVSPIPQVFISGRNSLLAYQSEYFDKAREAGLVKPGERIRRAEGSEAATVAFDLKDIAAHPRLITMGLGNGYALGLYLAEFQGKKVAVIADLSKASHGRMTFPDLYVIEEGKYLDVGRDKERDLSLQNTLAASLSAEYIDKVTGTISGNHLLVVFPENSQKIYVVDVSRNGHVLEPLKESSFLKDHQEMVPTEIKSYMLGK